MPTDESREYHPEPHTQSEYLSNLWAKVLTIDAKVTSINGRLGKMERAMWALGGGLAVVAAVVVPQWLGLIR